MNIVLKHFWLQPGITVIERSITALYRLALMHSLCVSEGACVLQPVDGDSLRGTALHSPAEELGRVPGSACAAGAEVLGSSVGLDPWAVAQYLPKLISEKGQVLLKHRPPRTIVSNL